MSPVIPKRPSPDNRRPGRQPKARPRYATHEEQARELLETVRRRDRRMAAALVEVLTGATPRVLNAVGQIVDFVARAKRAR